MSVRLDATNSKMPYNIAYVTFMVLARMYKNNQADSLCRMISDFFYPQPGGVESHIYQLSSVRGDRQAGYKEAGRSTCCLHDDLLTTNGLGRS